MPYNPLAGVLDQMAANVAPYQHAPLVIPIERSKPSPLLLAALALLVLVALKGK